MDRQCSSCGGFCKKSGCERENVDTNYYGYASRLAVAIWEQHYKDLSPQWKPHNGLMGVLTQIDNMTCGLTRPTQPAQRILELEALLERQTALLEHQTDRIVDLQTHIDNFEGEGG